MTEHANTPERTISQVALIGDSGVGKTALAYRLLGEDFIPTEATHGSTLYTFDNGQEQGTRFAAGLLDFGGKPRKELVEEIRQAHFSVAIVVADSRDDRIRDTVLYWSDILNSRDDKPQCTKFLVASRVDIGDVGGVASLEELAKAYNFSRVFLTSAKDGSGIQELRSAVLDFTRPGEEDAKDEASAVRLVVRTLAESLCRLVAESPHALREIEWRDLERLVAEALKGIGFAVELTPPAKDGGKDVILTCRVGSEKHLFYVEIKHWRDRRPGFRHLADFIEVNATANTDGGLFLSSSGYTADVYRRLGEICHQRIRLGEKDKIVSLCQNYIRSRNGVWQPEAPLPEILFERTLG